MSAALQALPLCSADGHRFELRVHECPAAQLGLLFVPAMGVSARNYQRFGDALAARGIRLAVHEYRGAGSSSLRASSTCNWGYRELLEQDLAASSQALSDIDSALPWLVGGHSLGAQLALLLAAIRPARFQGSLVLASGAPYWRSFPWWQGLMLRGVFSAFDVISHWHGHYPGRRLGFAGNEARGVIRDWGNSGRSGRYRVPGLDVDLEAALAQLDHPVLALRLRRDRYVPRDSLHFLLDKLQAASTESKTLGDELFRQGRADHFHWLQEPEPVADCVLEWARALSATDTGSA